MSFPGLKGQLACPITDEFDYDAHETSIGKYKVYSVANAMCDEALADAGIDT